MSNNSRVEVVLINYKHPANIPALVGAFRGQSEPCHITLVDAAPDPRFGLTEEIRQSVDHLFTWNHEFGPYNRYVPIAAFSHEFTYFHDDDMMPGNRVIEHFTEVADFIGEFGVLGQMGRYVDSEGAYIARDIRRQEHLVPVDIVVRGYFVRTKYLSAVVQLRLDLGLSPDPKLEDDLLLCTALNMIHGLQNYITPLDPDPETRMNKSALASGHARQGREIHFGDRTAFCRRAIAAGWNPLSRRNDAMQRNQQITVPTEPEGKQREIGQPIGVKDKHRHFNVNEYWLTRGQTYIEEERLYTEPYLRQEEFIIDGLQKSGTSPGRILEIGCGFGRITKRLAQAFPNARITALDISPDQLQNARAYCADYADRVQFIEYDIYSESSFPEPSYDAAIAVEVFMHHPQEAISQLLKRLSQVTDTVINYDWSEDWTGAKARHVWVHDYEDIYRDLGFECRVLVEPQKFRGQQQKLFIATRGHNVEQGNERYERRAPNNTPEPLTGSSACVADGVPASWIATEVRRPKPGNAASLGMKSIESRIPSDHADQATLDYYLKTFPKSGSVVDVLDLGCGTGKSFDNVKAHLPAFTWTGVDIAESSEVRSRTRTDCTFVTFDGVNLPFAEKSFDLVLSIQVFEHVRYPEQLLAEANRVLRPGGLFIGSVSQLEPFHSNSFWNFTYYGFANIAYDAGLRLRELRPGIDGLTLIIRNILNHGFRKSVRDFGPYFTELSPLNEWFRDKLGHDGNDIQNVNRMMLRYCGHFWFVFEVASEG